MQSFHIQILQAMKSLKFNIGKSTLVSFLQGDLNPTIERNNLDDHELYGSLHKLKKPHIFAIIGELEKDGLIAQTFTGSGLKTMRITPKGKDEIIKPSKEYTGEVKENIQINSITKQLKETSLAHLDSALNQFSFFLDKLNKKQQYSVIDPHNSILCVAGAGSGKTTVLVKRIEFLVKFRGVKQEEVLAITFTKKARDEMRERLEQLNLGAANIHTFNSFCEQQLRTIAQNDPSLVQSSQVLTFSQKIQIIRSILQEKNIQFEFISKEYFSSKQIKDRSSDDLFLLFCYEMFSILDYIKNSKLDIESFNSTFSQSLKYIGSVITTILVECEKRMIELRIRDFTDQILQTLDIYEFHKELIPKFSHVLVDEYQDINAIQLELVKKLINENLFCVGDPRQSIYNWRGSDISFILDFEEHFKGSHVIMLEYNYRSLPQLVDLGNQIIKPLKLNDLHSGRTNHSDHHECIHVMEHRSQEDEFIVTLSIIKKNLKEGISPSEIFVLARTNKMLEDFSKILQLHGIHFHLKVDDFSTKRQEPQRKDQIVLATIHAIKGQEAQKVIVLESSSLYFPNKVQDNEVIAHIKAQSSYDKYQEELRLFYVACTRAKDELFIMYTGYATSFLPEKYKAGGVGSSQKQLNTYLFSSKSSQLVGKNSNSNSNLTLQELKKLRLSISSKLGIQTHEIMNNHQLNEIVSKRPQTIEELEMLLMPNTFVVRKYGDSILKIVK